MQNNIFSKSILYFFLLNILLQYTAFSQEKNDDFTVESIWKKYEFYPKSFSGFKSMNDGEHFTQLNDEDKSLRITKHEFKNYKGKGEVLVSSLDLTIEGSLLQVDDYSFNADETKMLVTTNYKSVYRRSYTADFYILDLKTKNLSRLTDEFKNLTLADFSPDGKKIAFVTGNNIYYKVLETNKIHQVTFDGQQNEIINGASDWVYEEEFSITKTFEWSPDSKNIAFLKFDEHNVKEFQMAMYGELYPKQYTYKYPKAGEENSKVEAFLFSLESESSEKINLGEYEYIPRLKWAKNKNNLILQTLNRHQNHVKYHLLDLDLKIYYTKVIFEEKSDTYIEIDDNLLILNDGKSLLRTSEEKGFNHIQQVFFDGKSKFITQGNWDVIEFYGIDELTKTIYYASAEKGAIYKTIYKTTLDGKKKKVLSKETGYNNAEFSSGMKYFMNVYSDANTPKKYTLCNNEGKELAVLEDNSKLIAKMSTYNFSKREFIQIKGKEEMLNASIIYPPNFNPEKKYPVYMNVYGGPGSNIVTDEYDGNDYIYHQLLAKNGYVVICVDPRGTMYRGAKFKKCTYMQLGMLETEDFILAAKNISKMPGIDSDRIGIQGWSYGGYMTSLALAKGGDVFKMGIAVAPVTNWRYYDNIYTERFMRTPQENARGYDFNSPINFAKDIKGKYFIIHGSADDNVHYQNTMEMIAALTNANVQFDMFIYPNKNHGIYGGNTRNHLFNMMFKYTLKNL